MTKFISAQKRKNGFLINKNWETEVKVKAHVPDLYFRVQSAKTPMDR